ncbi:hypothetical protein JIN85_20580 [Luteolibacter pohnpeiensis]|uniref:Uncharacterized protein n=1 Tax=Luteolibacter pohnpeiensis TaxID=454153 RepID=A0A934SAH3_9BACT|nr:hypothetical protein [Luteolibacter pohnpeiensis]MBK1884818.1 hypothetical protein [Luteolibacter pohnpeiensis]
MTPPKRHGLLTAFLIFKIVAYSAVFCLYTFSADQILARSPHMPRWALTMFCFSSLAGIASVVAIFRWQKWGFYFSCATALIALPINLYSHVSPVGAFAGLFGPVILYGLLQLGGENKAWLYLR